MHIPISLSLYIHMYYHILQHMILVLDVHVVRGAAKACQGHGAPPGWRAGACGRTDQMIVVRSGDANKNSSSSSSSSCCSSSSSSSLQRLSGGEM